MKSCPYCGNPNVDADQAREIEVEPCSVCGHIFAPRTVPLIGLVQKNSTEDDPSPFDMFELREELGWHPEWETEEIRNYAKEYGIDELWEVFFWKGQGIDTSEGNIVRCQEIYDKKPNDPNNLFRILLLKIFAEKEYKSLAEQFLRMWHQRIIALGILQMPILEDCFSDSDLLKLKPFVTWLLDTNPKQAREEAKEEWQFPIMNKIVGIDEMSKLVPVESILIENLDFRWDDEYLKYLALAKYYYNQREWVEAFCLFEKLRIYNLRYGITNQDLQDLQRDIRFFSDILQPPLSVEDIADSSHTSFTNISFVNPSETESLKNLISNLHISLLLKEAKIQDQAKELADYLSVYNVFACILSKLAEEDYSAAFDEWVKWNKTNMKLMGLNVWNITQCLWDLKNSVGDKKKHLKSLQEELMPHQQMQMALVRIKEFILGHLLSYYKDDYTAWEYGIPWQVRRRSRGFSNHSNPIKMSNNERKEPLWDGIFPADYATVISFNWEKVFLQYFGGERKQIVVERLRSFIELRAKWAHPEKYALEETEKKAIGLFCDWFDKIYSAWEKAENKAT